MRSFLLISLSHNFLSVVMSSAPPPKLLLLEKWFRSEAQQEIRSQLKQASKKMDALIGRIEQQEERLQSMRETVKVLANLLYHAVTTAPPPSGAARVTSSSSFGDDSEAESKRNKAKVFGLETARIATDCLKKSTALQALPREERLLSLLGNACASVVFNSSSSGAGWPAYFEPGPGAGDDIRGDSILTKVPADRLNMMDVDLEALEGELVRTVQDWASILS
jgi:hypothetical protein